MPSASLITAGLALVILAAAAVALYPVLAADMRRTVERGAANDNDPDLTALAILLMGAGMLTGYPGVALWLALS